MCYCSRNKRLSNKYHHFAMPRLSNFKISNLVLYFLSKTFSYCLRHPRLFSVFSTYFWRLAFNCNNCLHKTAFAVKFLILCRPFFSRNSWNNFSFAFFFWCRRHCLQLYCRDTWNSQHLSAVERFCHLTIRHQVF